MSCVEIQSSEVIKIYTVYKQSSFINNKSGIDNLLSLYSRAKLQEKLIISHQEFDTLMYTKSLLKRTLNAQLYPL
ncbi:hypothetical protein [Yersinia phage vB_YenM_P778]